MQVSPTFQKGDAIAAAWSTAAGTALQQKIIKSTLHVLL